MPLTFDEEQRYSRHLILPGVGVSGQERLKNARVLLVGVGGLGSPVALYLAAAGVGTLGIADADTVAISNLQRQIIHSTVHEGRAKVESAAEAISRLNPLTVVQPIPARLTAENALEIIASYDVVVDGTDNFPTRYLLNDACVLSGKPLVFGSIYRFDGQATVFDAQRGPCYRCLFSHPPPPESVPTCAEGGVLGVLPGLVGMIQATETLKLLLDAGEPLIGRLMLVDALSMRFREVRMEKNPDCPLCGTSPTITALVDYQEFCGMTAIPDNDNACELTLEELSSYLATGQVRFLDVREEWEHDELPGISGAIQLPFRQLIRRMGELDTADLLAVYCATGARSSRAVDLLRRAGFARAWSVRDGLSALRQLCERR